MKKQIYNTLKQDEQEYICFCILWDGNLVNYKATFEFKLTIIVKIEYYHSFYSFTQLFNDFSIFSILHFFIIFYCFCDGFSLYFSLNVITDLFVSYTGIEQEFRKCSSGSSQQEFKIIEEKKVESFQIMYF